MTIFTTESPLVWGELDVPLLGLARDWQGAAADPMPGFCLAMDRRHLWFVANHRRAARLHPQARPGGFLAGLWEGDVAELFLADPVSGRYFEFNLAPNGAWWSCEFTAPRVRAEEAEIAMPEVATFAEMAPDGSWVAGMALPLDLLRARIGFGAETRANVSMILGEPQRFFSATPLPSTQPDFHQPVAFQKVEFSAMPVYPV